jgi:hypothetical protein
MNAEFHPLAVTPRVHASVSFIEPEQQNQIGMGAVPQSTTMVAEPKRETENKQQSCSNLATARLKSKEACCAHLLGLQRQFAKESALHWVRHSSV